MKHGNSGQRKYILVQSVAVGATFRVVEPYPDITTGDQGNFYSTGYCLRKGGAWDTKYTVQNRGYLGFPVYRAAEALLNYMEASYERNGALDASAREYWKLLRQRALVSDDIDATIAATDMAKEAENDWAAYSGGKLIDKTLYNIRRERRCEYLSEGLRWDDLCRWRAMDQMIETPWIPQGFHLWNTPMTGWYDTAGGGTKLIYGTSSANVSSPADGEYLLPYRKKTTQLCYNGFVWKMAHYLDPIRIDQMLITSDDGSNVETSPIYQNPYWPTEPSMPAEK